MIDDNLKSNSTFFFPFLSSKSNEGPLMLVEKILFLIQNLLQMNFNFNITKTLVRKTQYMIVNLIK